MTTDPEFAISGYVVNGLATVYCRWVNKGQFQKEAWDGVPLASMDVRAVMEGFGVFVDSQQGSQIHASFGIGLCCPTGSRRSAKPLPTYPLIANSRVGGHFREMNRRVTECYFTGQQPQTRK